MAQKRLTFTSKWTTAWQNGVEDASLNPHLQSFGSPIAMEERRPSLRTPTWRIGNCTLCEWGITFLLNERRT